MATAYWACVMMLYFKLNCEVATEIGSPFTFLFLMRLAVVLTRLPPFHAVRASHSFTSSPSTTYLGRLTSSLRMQGFVQRRCSTSYNFTRACPVLRRGASSVVLATSSSPQASVRRVSFQPGDTGCVKYFCSHVLCKGIENIEVHGSTRGASQVAALRRYGGRERGRTTQRDAPYLQRPDCCLIPYRLQCSTQAHQSFACSLSLAHHITGPRIAPAAAARCLLSRSCPRSVVHGLPIYLCLSP
eukprot:357902-Chlamydomonas_euryale.AAC.5